MLMVCAFNFVCSARGLKKYKIRSQGHNLPGSCDLILYLRTPPISLERLKVQTPNFACGLTTRDTKPKDEKLVKSGRGPGHNLLFKFFDPLISLEWLQIQTSNFACVLRVRHTKPKKIKSWCWKWPAVPFPRYLLTRCVTQLLVGV